MQDFSEYLLSQTERKDKVEKEKAAAMDILERRQQHEGKSDGSVRPIGLVLCQ